MIIYHTDGSCDPNPGSGGYAVIKNMKPYLIGKQSPTTSIRMEGVAIWDAIQDSAGEECEIHTDSLFWINVITLWAPKWEANGWSRGKKEIANLDLVKILVTAYRGANCKLVHVRGHKGIPGNEMADEWATHARLGGTVDDRVLLA